jgi:hypothetical protein
MVYDLTEWIIDPGLAPLSNWTTGSSVFLPGGGRIYQLVGHPDFVSSGLMMERYLA